jgi:hypothetical protein
MVQQPVTPPEPAGTLNPEQHFQLDMRFQPGYRDWRREYMTRFREEPNYNDPDFDYRAAWGAGAVPERYEHDDNRFHWPSGADRPPRADGTSFKGPNHPTAWMETFMQAYGVDPHEASPEQLTDALRRGIVPLPQ